MSNRSIITQAMKNRIGVNTEPVTYVVETGAIKKFAQAIGDPNPLYNNESFASSTFHGGIIAPPTFLKSFNRWASMDTFKNVYPNLLDGGSEWEYFDSPVRPGDRITVTSKIVDLNERSGRLGGMLLATLETHHINELGNLIAIERNTLIYYRATEKIK